MSCLTVVNCFVNFLSNYDTVVNCFFNDTTTDLPVYCTCWWVWLQVPHPLNSSLLSTDIAADQPLGSGSSHVQGGWRQGVFPVPSDTF